jgi:hypothetical protein
MSESYPAPSENLTESPHFRNRSEQPDEADSPLPRHTLLLFVPYVKHTSAEVNEMFTFFLRIFTKNVIPISPVYVFDMARFLQNFPAGYKQAVNVTGA